ncbi:MAG: cytochrome B6 [Pirellulaceae bacterium]|nr:cytochrome B6 [Pirellulaceae bacterium]
MKKAFVLMGVILLLLSSATQQIAQPADDTKSPTKPETYMPVVVEDFETMRAADVSKKTAVMTEQLQLLESRYDLSDSPSKIQMSAGRKPVQQGIRVKLPKNATWAKLSSMSAQEIRDQELFPAGFRPLPHVKHATGGMVFPKAQIDQIKNAEHRDLSRFDTDFDIPDRFTPEYPPPMFLTTHPGMDVTDGQVLTIKNYFKLLKGKITPVQMEGMRLLLTPFPQQQFNQTDDRKVEEPSLGVSCLDCHVNGHTNATFHLNPDTRPQQNRFRIETISLRGVFNQQIHGSKRSLRSIEDFTEFEQRTAYFDGDHVTAAKKGVHLPNRSDQVAMMAQMQSMLDFPPAPKLDVYGKLISSKATAQELKGQELFFGKAKCSVCHPAPFYLDNLMHDLQVQRFYEPKIISDHYDVAVGPIKTFTLRGIKDSPPYLHDGRLLTLDDTVAFFNIILSLGLTDEESKAIVAFMTCL